MIEAINYKRYGKDVKIKWCFNMSNLGIMLNMKEQLISQLISLTYFWEYTEISVCI